MLDRMMRFMSNNTNVFEGDDITMDKVLDDEFVEYSMSTPNDKCRDL